MFRKSEKPKSTNSNNLIAIAILVVLFTLGCFNASPASLKGVTIAKDEAGKQPTTKFRVGETVHAIAEISGETDGVILEFYLVKADVDTSKLSGSKFASDLKGEKRASFWMELEGVSPGRYAIVTRLVKTDKARRGTGVTEMKEVFEVR